MEVLRRYPLAITQRLVRCAIAVSTAVLDRVTKTMSVALLLMNSLDNSVEAKDGPTCSAQLHLPTHDPLFWAKLRVQLHLPPLRSLDLCGPTLSTMSVQVTSSSVSRRAAATNSFHLSHNNTDSGLDARVYTFKIENNVVRLCRHSWLTRCPRVSRAGEWPAWDKPMIESLINRIIDYVTLSLSSSL